MTRRQGVGPFEQTDDSGGVAVVAGASRGLGLEITRLLVARGWRVHGFSRNRGSLDRVEDGLVGPGSFVAHRCDVRDPAAVDALVRQVWDDDGHIDLALHVAGVIEVGPVRSVTLGHLREAVDTMLWGPVHLCLAVVPLMRSRGRGRIGVLSSVGGLVAVPRLLPYSVAKFAAVGLAEGLAAELSGTGVSVTSITPWLMRTGGHEHARFTGDGPFDRAWFAPGASLPVLSVPVERAARRIVDGTLDGRPCVGASPLVSVARRVHGLAPATTVRALGLAQRLLGGDGPQRSWLRADAPFVEGASDEERRRAPILDALTLLGRRAARSHNE